MEIPCLVCDGTGTKHGEACIVCSGEESRDLTSGIIGVTSTELATLNVAIFDALDTKLDDLTTKVDAIAVQVQAIYDDLNP